METVALHYWYHDWLSGGSYLVLLTAVISPSTFYDNVHCTAIASINKRDGLKYVFSTTSPPVNFAASLVIYQGCVDAVDGIVLLETNMSGKRYVGNVKAFF